MKSEENKKAIKFFQERVKAGKSSVSPKELQELSIDLTNKSQSFRNISLKKDFWGDWALSVKNENADLDGNLICDNKKLINILKTNWENGTAEIKFQDLIHLNIWTPSSELKIGNFHLDSSMSSKVYRVSLSDKAKNMDGLWIDKAITMERILQTLHQFEILQTELDTMSEVALNKLLEAHFKNHFEVVRRGGSSNQGLIDIILGANHNFGIELKLGRETVKSSQSDRARGQVERYIEQFGVNFVMIIAGTAEERADKYTQAVVKKVKELKGTFYFLEGR